MIKDDAYEYLRDEIRSGKGSVEYTETAIPGTGAVNFLHPYMPYPLGTVYYRLVGNNSCEILDSFVKRPLRLIGIRTRIHEAMCDWLKGYTIFTADSSGKASEAWLEKVGFAKDDRLGWVFAVEDD